VPPDEIELAVAYLGGVVRQEKLGLGWAGLQAAADAVAEPDAHIGTREPDTLFTAAAPALEESTAAATELAEAVVEPSKVHAESSGASAERSGASAERSGAGVELAELDATLERIAGTTGKGSADARRRLLRGLLARLGDDERHFLFGLVMGELRQGALDALVIEAVARAAGLPADDVRRAVMLTGDLPHVARAALTEGAAGLARFAVQLFRPVLPMLAGSADSAAEALAELGEAALEWKLDGARVQIHKADDEVRVYSRRLNEVTPAVPEIADAVRALPTRELILEGEAIALRADGIPHPFQTTMTRFGRRLDVERVRGTVPLTLFLFDLLYLDGVSLLDEPLARRAAMLADCVPSSLLVPRTQTASAEEAERFLADALARGHEGIMAKALDSPYEAGRRGRRWLKVKPVRTLDLVVLAAEWGHGRRRGWLSNLHLGARDDIRGGFVMLGKTFKGMTDELLAWQTTRLQELEVSRDGHTVYVRPELVVEVAFNDLQASPQYPGGLALRFARVKGYRPDKSAAEADTLSTLLQIWRRQTGLEPPEVGPAP
jgi:DNA ligase 1